MKFWTCHLYIRGSFEIHKKIYCSAFAIYLFGSIVKISQGPLTLELRESAEES